MLLVIHNLPLNTRFGDVKTLLLEKCGLRNLILDKLVYEDNAMKITVGLPTEEDAALMVRKINGLYVKGHQLYVQDLRQKPSEQPYRLPKPVTQKLGNQPQGRNNNPQGWNDTPQGWNDNSQSWNDKSQSWNDNSQSWNDKSQGWNDNPQGWNDNPPQTWNNNQQQGWNNNPQQNWNSNKQQNWNSNQQQNWNNPVQPRSNESQRKSNPFLYPQQNQNVQSGQELVAAAALWAQQAQQSTSMYDNQSVQYPQNVQYPPQYGQVDNQGYGAWGQGNQSGGDYSAARGRSPERGRPFERDSLEHSRPQGGKKRRWNDSERRDDDDDWRQRPASPPREFRQHHRGQDKPSPQRPEPWADAPNQRFQPSNPRFDGSKPRFDTPKPKFEPKSKFNKKQKFNSPNQKFNPRFIPPNSRPNAPNSSKFGPKKDRFEGTPWDQLTDKQQQKIIKRNEIYRSKTVNRITFDIFNCLGLDQSDVDLKKYFTDPVRSRLNKVLGNDKFLRLDMMYAKFLDAYDNDKQKILEEAKQLQRDGVQPELQNVFIRPVFGQTPFKDSDETSGAPQPKRFKGIGDLAQTGYAGPPKPAPSYGEPPKPVSGKIPSYVDGDKKKFKAIKQQHLKDMVTLRCPEISPELEKIVDEEIEDIANIFHKVIENTPAENLKKFLRERASEECLNDFKKMFKQKICQRLTNEGPKIVRIYAAIGKPPKKAELEPFMRQFGTIALKKSDRKPFFTAHLDSYETMDKLCNMGNVSIGSCEVVFKPLHMTPKYKRVHMSSLNKMRNKYVADQIKKPEVNILEKDWEVKLAAVKEREQKLKQENEEKLKQENDAKKENDVKAENGNVEAGNANVKAENTNVKAENANVKPENTENNMEVHTDKYGKLHANFDVIDEVQGSDTENDHKNDDLDFTADDFIDDEVGDGPGKSDESLLRELPVVSDHEIIYDDDDNEEGRDNDGEGEDDGGEGGDDGGEGGDDGGEGGDDGGEDGEVIAEDIDLDNIDENDLEDY